MFISNVAKHQCVLNLNITLVQVHLHIIKTKFLVLKGFILKKNCSFHNFFTTHMLDNKLGKNLIISITLYYVFEVTVLFYRKSYTIKPALVTTSTKQ